MMIISSLLFADILYANPSPLGIELNKSTLDDVKKSYRIVTSNQNEGYYYNVLDVQNVPIETLSRIILVSNSKNIIEVVLIELSKDKFDETYKMLSSKYKVLSSELPFVGDKYAKLQDGDCHILINAPHMSFTTSVMYTTKDFENKYHDRADKEQAAKQEQTKELL